MLLRGMSIHSRWEPGLLFVGLLIFYVACPVNTPFDSAWYLPTALSILKEGKVNIDEYAPTFHQGHGTIQVNGHWYNDYPLGPALVALPFVAAAELLFRGLAPFSALSPKIARWVDRWRYHSCATGEINLDFWNIPQRVIASILVSIAAVLMFLIASQSLSRPRALLLTLGFALGTSALSTATRALWQHGPSMLFLSLTLFCLLKSRVSPRWLLGAGLAIALAYIMRPTNAVSTLFVSVYVLIKYPRKWYWYLAGALIVAVPWTALNLSLYGNPLPPYYQPGRFELDARSFPNAAMANLFSPSRGLFLFTPVALFAIVGVGRKIVSHSFDSLDLLLVATVLAHWVVVSLLRSTLPYRRVALSLLSHDSGDWCLDLGFHTRSDRDRRFWSDRSDQFCDSPLWSRFMGAPPLERRTCECRPPPQSCVGLERSAILTWLAQGAHDFIA